MALLVPDAGEVSLLDMMLSDASPNAQTLRLYSAVSPALSESTVHTDFTEATFTGYTSKTLARATWNGASSSAGTTSKTYPQQSWSPTSSQTILGYYVTEAVAGGILWAEEFAAARALVSGDTLNLTPAIELA
jgi:hypothetical protein